MFKEYIIANEDQMIKDLGEMIKIPSKLEGYNNPQYPFGKNVDDALNKGKRNLPSYILYFRSSKYNYLEGYERYGQIGDNIYFYKSEDK